MSFDSLLTCVKDAYLEVDKHWMFEFKHWLELSIEAQVSNDNLYGKKTGWLPIRLLFCGFVVLFVLGTVWHHIYGITLQNGVTGLVNRALSGRVVCILSSTWFWSRYWICLFDRGLHTRIDVKRVV